MTSAWAMFLAQITTEPRSRIRFKHHFGQWPKTSVSRLAQSSTQVPASTSMQSLPRMGPGIRQELSLISTRLRWRLSQVPAFTTQRSPRLILSIAWGRRWTHRWIGWRQGQVPTKTDECCTIRPSQVLRWAKTCASRITFCTRPHTRSRIQATTTCTISPTMSSWAFPSLASVKILGTRTAATTYLAPQITRSRLRWLMVCHASQCQADERTCARRLEKMAKGLANTIHGTTLSRKMGHSSQSAKCAVTVKLAYLKIRQEPVLMQTRQWELIEPNLQAGGKHK